MAAADNDHNTAVYADCLAGDVVVHLLGGQELRGLDAYRSFVESLFAGMPDYYAEAIDVVDSGEVVMVHWTITGTHTGTLFGIAATGRRVQYSGCSVWHVPGGQIVEGWMYPDRTSMLAQLGVT